MTFLNFTFQDPSPLISYSSQWVEGFGDQFIARYSGGSFKETNAAGATATVAFVGTSITIYGAQRFNHGNYSVTFDGGPELVGDGHVNNASDNVFQFPFWNAQNLSNTEHTVILTNIPTTEPFLDIDFISIGREIGPTGYTGPIFNVTLDDESPFVVYDGSWSPSFSLTALNSSIHSTTEEGSSVSVVFQGSSIELYGLYVNAPFQANVDNQLPRSLAGPDVNLSTQEEHPQTLLFLADGLDENKTHVATLVNSASNSNRPLYFDYAIARSSQKFFEDIPSPDPNFTIPVPGSHSTMNITSPTHMNVTSPSTMRKDVMATGDFIGGVVGGVAGVIVIAFIGFILFRRSKYYQRAQGRRIDLLDSVIYNIPAPFILKSPISPDSAVPSQPSHLTTENNQQSNPLIVQTYAVLQERDASQSITMSSKPPSYAEYLDERPYFF